MISTIDHKYSIGDIVYLVTDTDQLPRMVFSLEWTKGDIMYNLTHCTLVSKHYEFELSDTKNIILTSSS